MWPRSALMVSPIGFKVNYAINPYMTDENGNLNQVDTELAHQQWTNLKSKLIELGVSVDAIDGDPNCPDMVFCANQTFPFIKNKKKSVLLSRMNSKYRQPEVIHFRNWAEKNNFDVYEISDYQFEGCGDAIYNYESGDVFIGHGFRTDSKVIKQIESITSQKLIPLALTTEDFYHLDTCFMVLNKGTAAYVPEAFSGQAIDTLKSKFKDLIVIDYAEAKSAFAGNGLCVNGKDVIVHKGAPKLTSELLKRDFVVHEVDVSEFLKAGGAIFCMKQMLF